MDQRGKLDADGFGKLALRHRLDAFLDGFFDLTVAQLFHDCRFRHGREFSIGPKIVAAEIAAMAKHGSGTNRDGDGTPAVPRAFEKL